MSVRVGSRKSQLALIQTENVVNELKTVNNQMSFEIVSMTTTGDQILDKALSKIGEKSLFTKELEMALEKREVSFVVHSLKDLPTILPQGMAIGAVCRRADPSDAVVFRDDSPLASLGDLVPGSVVGTSSLRRVSQLRYLHPHLTFETVRGNLNTRLKKLDEGQMYSALILAAAGLKRLGWERRISYTLGRKECMYAVGQGALAVECRQDDQETLRLLAPLSDRETLLRCVAERSFMRTLAGGCTVPIAVWSTLDGDVLELEGGVFSLDGSKRVTDLHAVTLPSHVKSTIPDWTEVKSFCGIVAPLLLEPLLSAAEKLGINLANSLLKAGAADILKEIDHSECIE